MIFVTVGTIYYPFHRLIKIVLDFNKKNQTKEKIIIQSGHTDIKINTDLHPNVEILKFVKNKQMEKYFKRAQTIICSGGEGTIIHILTKSTKRPIIFPRLKQYREHIDNQQLFIGQALYKKNLAYLATNEDCLNNLLKKRRSLKKNACKLHTLENSLVESLSNFTIQNNTNSFIN